MCPSHYDHIMNCMVGYWLSNSEIGQNKLTSRKMHIEQLAMPYKDKHEICRWLQLNTLFRINCLVEC